MKSAEYSSRQDIRTPFNHVFLTGATGVLGGNVLKQLLKTSDATIFCLVRAGSNEEGLVRLRRLFDVYDPEGQLEGEFLRRVRVVVGEVTEKGFGLSEKEFQSLAEKVDFTIHGAAITNLFLKMSTVAPVNIEGTRNVLEFVEATPSRRMMYVSTYTVMGDKTFDPSVVFMEKDYDIGQGFDYMTYQKSKFIAEGIIRSSDVTWMIVRPGQIFGESDTGHYPQGQSNISGLFYDIFKTVIESGVAFDSRTPFDVVPVNYVSKAMLSLAATGLFGKTFHLTNPDVKSYTEVIDLLRGTGYDIKAVSQAEYRDLLFTRTLKVNDVEYKSPTVSAFRWWFKREKFDFEQGARTCCEATRQILEARGVTCHPVDSTLISTYVDAGVRMGFFPEPKNLPAAARRSEKVQSAS